MPGEPEYYASHWGSEWRKISRQVFERYIDGMDQTPDLFEGVRIAIQFTLVVFS